jgi:transcriptional regulator with XRE-family HTH domain
MKRGQYPEGSLVVEVGKRIRALREAQGDSLRVFGKLASVHPFHVMAIELGQLAANTKTLRRIASALGVAVADLLNCDENDDYGAIVEMMRTQPDSVRQVMLRVRK